MKKLATRTNVLAHTSRILRTEELRHATGGGSWSWVGDALTAVGLASRDDSGGNDGNAVIGVRG